MSTSAIINVRNFDINRVSFVVGQAKNGRNASITIKYDGQNFLLRLPRMSFPGGVLARDGQKPGDPKSYTMIGSLKGCDPYAKDHSSGTDDLSKLYNILLDLEEKILVEGERNSVKWFGKKRSMEGLRESFKKLLRVSVDKVDGEYIPNGKYPPSVTLKVPVYDNRVSMDIIDNKGNPIYVSPSTLLSVLPKGMEGSLVVAGSIYVMAGGGFGVTWRITYAQVFPQARVTAAQVFADEIEEDDSQTTAVATKPVEDELPPLVSEETQLNVDVPDLDDSPAPAPAPASRKRRVAVGSV